MPRPPHAVDVVVDPSRHAGWSTWIDGLRRRAAAAADPARARPAILAAVLDHLARADGWDPRAGDLRLGAVDPDPEVAAPPDGLGGPDLLGAVHEALLAPADRRAAGAHYTPPALAGALVAWALAGWDGGEGPALRTVDLSVGGGAFLLAVARHQRGAGRPVGDVLAALAGVDADPGAVAVTEAALVAWARAEGGDGDGDGVRPALVVADGTRSDPFGSPGPRPGSVDLVVGNPPFRSQLGRSTARDPGTAARLRAEWGDSVTGYVDDAAVFLRAACSWPRPGGRVVLVQPESVLAARDAAGVRAAVADRADLVGLWVAGEPAFDADVDVCAPVLEVRGPGTGAAPPPVARAEGVTVRPAGAAPVPTGPSWAPLLARQRGVPATPLVTGAGTLGDLVTVVAGFRQHFYALAPHLREAGPDPEGSALAPVLTTGLVDPLVLGWGERAARIAGRRWDRPSVDLDAVAADAPGVAAWARARLRPKVVVAPQTRVVEAAVDLTGRFVPGVPLVSVEPRHDASAGAGGGAADLLWRVAAVLLAPPITAWAMERAAGTARHRDALRLAPAQVRVVPLPADRRAWEAAAADLRAGRPLEEVGPDLAAAYGVAPDHPVVAWWRSRLPRRP